MKNIDLKTYIEKHTDFTVLEVDTKYDWCVIIRLERYYSSEIVDYNRVENVTISFHYSSNSIGYVSAEFLSYNNIKLFNSLLKKYYKNKMKEGE